MIHRMILIPFIFLFFITGCGKKEVEEVLNPSPVPEIERLPVDYVFLIDNSGSIPPGDARELAKEAIKAFVELSDANDKISVMTFDKDTRLIASNVITDFESRRTIKRAVETNITFEGQYTDISSALSYVKANRTRLFRGRGSIPAVILVSDGRLQPPPQINIDDAYRRLKEDVQALSNIPFYTIGLGEKDIYVEFLPKVNGFILLKDQIASATGGKFHHIKSVDEMIETCFKILRLTKQVFSVEGQYVFHVDESTKSILAIVFKRTSTKNICATTDIFVKRADGKAVTYANYPTIHPDMSWQTSKYYDILRINNPAEGRWEVSLKNGATPELISLVKSFINLRYKVKKIYWDKERQQIIAWLYDERKGGLSNIPCEIVLETEKRSLPMTETENGTYVAELSPALPKGDYFVRIRAENPSIHFYRITDHVPFSVKESFFSFEFPKDRLSKSIFKWSGVKFKGFLDTKSVNYPRFQAIPDVILRINRVDDEGRHHPLLSKKLHSTAEQDKMVYEADLTDLPLGRYSSYFEMKGLLVTGESVDILSQDFSFRLKRASIDIASFVTLALIMLGIIIYSARPKLRGSLQIVFPSPQFIDLKSIRKRNLRGDHAIVGANIGLNIVSFTIRAMRKGVKKLRVDSGSIRVSGIGGKSIQVNAGEAVRLQQGDEISFTDSGLQYKIKIF